MIHSYKTQKIYRGIIGIIILIGLLMSFSIQLSENIVPSISGRILGYTSYFTELSNILIVIWYFNKAFFKEKFKFFNKDSVRGAITLYICVTGLIFFFILNEIWRTHGLTHIEQYILHGLSPVAFILDYLLFSKKGIYKFKSVLLWILFPIGYLFYVMIVGCIIHVYPYPFLNMNTLTIGQLINNLSHILIPAFIIVGLLIVVLDRLIALLCKLLLKNNNQ